MSRIIHPVELHDEETKIVKDLQKKGAKALKRRVSASEIIRRAIRLGGPKLLSGEEPLVESVTIANGR